MFKKIPKAIVEVDHDVIRISRKGFFSFFMHGLKGEKTIPIKNITAVQLKKPGMTVGYLQFSQHGMLEDEGGLINSFSDENSVTLRQSEYEQALEIKNYIEDFQRTQDGKSVAGTSDADELKKFKELFDEGIITEEEYENKKRQILNA